MAVPMRRDTKHSRHKKDPLWESAMELAERVAQVVDGITPVDEDAIPVELFSITRHQADIRGLITTHDVARHIGRRVDTVRRWLRLSGDAAPFPKATLEAPGRASRVYLYSETEMVEWLKYIIDIQLVRFRNR